MHRDSRRDLKINIKTSLYSGADASFIRLAAIFLWEETLTWIQFAPTSIPCCRALIAVLIFSSTLISYSCRDFGADQK